MLSSVYLWILKLLKSKENDRISTSDPLRILQEYDVAVSNSFSFLDIQSVEDTCKTSTGSLVREPECAYDQKVEPGFQFCLEALIAGARQFGCVRLHRVKIAS